MSDTPAVPAGFYDDGSGRQRWWDGAAWTDQYQDAPAVPAPGVAPVAAEAPKKKRRALPIVLSAVGAFIVLLVVIGALSNHPAKTASDVNPIATTAADNPANTPTPSPTPTGPTYTLAQQNAIAKAKSYLGFEAFSRSGLIDQLKFDGFEEPDATFAVDTIAPDWNAQAAAKAKSYMKLESFSKSALIGQLEFDGFTPDQAAAGAAAVGY